jgi:peptide/nickel transport system substrate-binding protein
MYSRAWVGIKSPDIFRYAFHSQSLPPAGANRGRLRDRAVDRLIEQASAASDATRQATLYADLQQRLRALLPYVPLWYEDQFVAMGPGIEGYRLAPDGGYGALAQVRRVTGTRVAAR